MTSPEQPPAPQPDVTKNHDDEGGPGMTLWEHLEDLRWVLLKSLLIFVLGAVAVGLFSVTFKAVLDWPLTQGAALAGAQGENILRTRGPVEVFGFIFQMVFFGALAIALPFALYFTSGFVAPGLTPRERQMLRPVCLATLALFVAGCALSYLLVLPMMIAASVWMNDVYGFETWWAPGPYYGAVVWTTLGLGIIFEFPLVLVVLQYLDILDAQTLRAGRRYAVVIILIFAALITPTGDPITLMLVSAPLYALYEGAIAVGEKVVRRAREKAEREGLL